MYRLGDISRLLSAHYTVRDDRSIQPHLQSAQVQSKVHTQKD